MEYFTIPADFKKETIDGYARLNDTYKNSKVLETYGNITVGNMFGGGREYEDIPKININDLKEYIEYSAAKGIDFNYTLNGACFGNREFTEDGVIELKRFLNVLYSAGVRKLTVALPSVIELIKSMDLDFEIKASAFCSINNVNKALTFKNAGVDRIVVEEAINREFEILRDIRESFGETTEVIVNVICYKDCTYRPFHNNQTSHDSINNKSKSISTYYSCKCMLKRMENVGNFFKLSWIRPEDIKYYSNLGIHYFKIQGRDSVLKGDPIRAVEAYFRQSFEGDLYDLLKLFSDQNPYKIGLDNKKLDGYLNPFLNIPNFCKRNCAKCNYCEEFAKKCTDYNQAKETIKLAAEFYTEYDEYKQLIKSVNNMESIDKSNGNMEETLVHAGLDFDFDLV